MAIPRINGQIPIWKRGDTVPTDAQGGYAGGDGAAAAVSTSLAQSKAAWDTVDKLTVTGTSVDFGQPLQVTVSGVVPHKVVNFKIPKGMPEDAATSIAHDAAAAVANSQAVLGDYEGLVTLAQQAQAAALEVPDSNVSALIGNPVSETRAAGDAHWAPRAEVYERPIQPINAGAYEGTNDAAIRAAFNDAMTQGRPIEVPDKRFNLVGDLVLTPTVQSERISILGTGDKSELWFDGGGLRISGTGMLAHRPTLENLNIRRSGTPGGAALHLHASGEAGTGVARWYAANVFVTSTQGTACVIEGSYIGDFVGCYFLASVDGLQVIRETARGITGANAVNFIGGEIQGNQRGVTMTAAHGVSFLGTSIEGNSTYGVELGDECNGITFNGIYCEANGGYDIRVNGSSTTEPMGGISIQGGTFLDAGAQKASSIELVKGQGIDIAGNYWGNQSFAPIRVNEAIAGDVVGGQRNNLRHYPMPGNAQDIVDYGATGAPYFEKFGAGRVYSIPVDMNPVPPHSTIQIALNALGVRNNDLCTVSTRSLLESGLIPLATVSAPDTIVLRLANVTAAEINPAGRTWDFRVSR